MSLSGSAMRPRDPHPGGDPTPDHSRSGPCRRRPVGLPAREGQIRHLVRLLTRNQRTRHPVSVLAPSEQQRALLPFPSRQAPACSGRSGERGRARGARATLLALLVAFVPTGAGAQALDEVVGKIESTYGRIQDLRADFSQVSHNKSLGQDIKAEGTVFLKRGGKMRWEYTSPSPQQIVSDGKFLWVYTPELNQVNKGEAPKALAGPAGSFLAGLGKVRDEFTVRFLNPASRTDPTGRPVLDLTPKSPTPFLSRLVLTVDPKDHVVRQAVIYDQLQNTVTMTFANIATNSGLADSLFTFTPPQGAAVVPLEPR
jgi:outer membrane lipoprotein carrier protein